MLTSREKSKHYPRQSNNGVRVVGIFRSRAHQIRNTIPINIGVCCGRVHNISQVLWGNTPHGGSGCLNEEPTCWVEQSFSRWTWRSNQQVHCTRHTQMYVGKTAPGSAHLIFNCYMRSGILLSVRISSPLKKQDGNWKRMTRSWNVDCFANYAIPDNQHLIFHPKKNPIFWKL